jgi:hypothetical protein
MQTVEVAIVDTGLTGVRLRGVCDRGPLPLRSFRREGPAYSRSITSQAGLRTGAILEGLRRM